MTTFNKLILSGSTDGRGIKVVQAATAGTTIHTGTSTASDYDEVWCAGSQMIEDRLPINN